MIQEATSGKRPWSADLLADSKSQKVAGIVWAAKKLVSEELFFILISILLIILITEVNV